MAWTDVIALDFPGNDFIGAQEVAAREARRRIDDPMVLAWYDHKSDRSFPDVTCCSELLPGWVVYAKSRGGRLIVDVNEGEYVFVFV